MTEGRARMVSLRVHDMRSLIAPLAAPRISEMANTFGGRSKWRARLSAVPGHNSVLIRGGEYEFAAIDHEGLPGRVAACIAREVESERRNLFGLGYAPHGIRIASRFFDHLDQWRRHHGANQSGSDAVDPDLVARPFLRTHLGQSDQRSLAHRICSEPEAGADALV